MARLIQTAVKKPLAERILFWRPGQGWKGGPGCAGGPPRSPQGMRQASAAGRMAACAWLPWSCCSRRRVFRPFRPGCRWTRTPPPPRAPSKARSAERFAPSRRRARPPIPATAAAPPSKPGRQACGPAAHGDAALRKECERAVAEVSAGEKCAIAIAPRRRQRPADAAGPRLRRAAPPGDLAHLSARRRFRSPAAPASRSRAARCRRRSASASWPISRPAPPCARASRARVPTPAPSPPRRRPNRRRRPRSTRTRSIQARSEDPACAPCSPCPVC